MNRFVNESMLRVIALCAFSVLLLISACTSADRYPEEIRAGSLSRSSTITLNTEEITFTQEGSAPRDVEFKITQTTMEDRSKRRRAFLTLESGARHYIGEFTPIFDESRLEFLFAKVDEARIVMLWIDEDLLDDPDSIWLVRPLSQIAGDDAIKSIRYPYLRRIVNQTALFVITPHEAEIWETIQQIALFDNSTSDSGPTWERTFEPPLAIEPNYIEVNLE